MRVTKAKTQVIRFNVADRVQQMPVGVEVSVIERTGVISSVRIEGKELTNFEIRVIVSVVDELLKEGYLLEEKKED